MDTNEVKPSSRRARSQRGIAVKHAAVLMCGLATVLFTQGCSFGETAPPPPAPSTIAITSTPGVTTAPAAAACPARFYQTATTVTDSPGDPLLDEDPLYAPTDTGARDRATGTVTVGPNNIPVAYTVAPDDLRENVADRFCLTEHYFESLNQVRTNVSATLYAGDTLNLNPYTISLVGDQNGTVSTNPLPTPAPPQQAQ